MGKILHADDTIKATLVSEYNSGKFCLFSLTQNSQIFSLDCPFGKLDDF